MKNNQEYFTTQELADHLKVHVRTIYNAIKCGRIQAFRIGRGEKASYRIFKSEIKRMAAFDAADMIENIISKRKEK